MRFQEAQNLFSNIESLSDEFILNYDPTNISTEFYAMGHGLGGITSI